jgi:hypothetical protein
MERKKERGKERERRGMSIRLETYYSHYYSHYYPLRFAFDTYYINLPASLSISLLVAVLSSCSLFSVKCYSECHV